MQSGLYYGYLSLVEGMLAQIKAEMKFDPIVVATGGLAQLIVGNSALVHHIDPLLTLEGLRIIYEKNQPWSSSMGSERGNREGEDKRL
jgi:type III pantothenate kinase